MLQQTVVATVIPYYQRFLRLFPSVQDLAAADEAAVLHAWSGLGYYSRARNLKRAAQMVVEQFGGQMPDTEEDLQRLPGVGPYTASAVAAIAYGRVAFALDGNAIRVMARVINHQGLIDDDATKTRLRACGLALVPKGRSGDFAQAVMDLGARICVPKNPKCAVCPVAPLCVGFAQGTAKQLPRRKPRRPKKRVHLLCLALLHKGQVLLQKRPAPGLLGGTWTLPSVPLGPGDQATDLAAGIATAFGITVRAITTCPAPVHHIFTHLDVWADVVVARASRLRLVPQSARPDELRWVPCDAASTLPLASFTKKLLACVESLPSF